MKKLLSLVLVLGIIFSLTGCGLFSKESKDGKYDVTIRIVSPTDGKSFIFTPDVKDIYYEIEYDGEEHEFYVDGYQYEDHPRFAGTWFTPHGHNFFIERLNYCPPGGKNDTCTGPIKEKGVYCKSVKTNIDGDENSWR